VQNSAMPKLLLTAFEPFGGDTINPSQEIVRRLEGSHPDIATLVLPCAFDDALAVLDAALARLAPDVVIALGQAAERAEISVERIAVNLSDARIADNAGRQPVDTPVVADGPPAYFSTLPVKAIIAALNDAGIPAAQSLSAGSFVCNHVFYGLAHRIAAGTGPRSGGFIHLPCLPEQAASGRPGMALETMLAGVQLAIETALAEAQPPASRR